MKRDEGSVLLLAIGAVVVAALAALVIFDASSLYMRKTALLTHADNVAIAAAQAIDVDALYQGEFRLDPASAVRVAHSAVAGTIDARLRDIRLEQIDVAATEVQVTLSAAVPAPLSRIAGVRTVRIRASARAAAVQGG